MFSFLPRERKIGGLFLSFLVVLLFILYYFFVYVKGREQNLVERNFRGLQRMATNTSAQLDNFRRLIPDSVINPNSLNDTLEEENGVRVLFLKEDSAKGSLPKEIRIKEKDGKSYLNYQNTSKVRDSEKITLQAYWLIKAFFDRLLRKDMFEGYVVIREWDLKGPVQVIYESYPLGAHPYKTDSLFQKNAALRTADVVSLSVAGRPCKVFVQPLQVSQSERWLICGILPEADFRESTRTISGRTVAIVLTLLVLLIIAMPLVKLPVMSRNERLHSADVIYAAVSLALLTSVLYFLMLFSFVSVDGDNRKNEKQLETLANSIEKSFRTELDSVYTQLVQAETLLVHNSKDKILKPPFIDLLTHYKNMEYIFWLDKKGRDTIMWSRDSTPLKRDYSSRQYFRRIRDGKEWLLNSGPNKFFLESVYSWTDHQFRACISKPVANSAKYTAIVMATSLRSVMDPVLPYGTGFCIVDEKGEVQFHSEKERSLNENFLEECDHAPELKAALQTRNGQHTSIRYHQRKYQVYVQPVGDLPLFVVTFLDSAAYAIPSVGTAYSYSMYTGIMVFFVAGIVGLLLLVNFRQTRLKLPVFLLSKLLFPAGRYNAGYIKVFITNCVLLVLLLLAMCRCLFADAENPDYLLFLFPCAVVLSMGSFFLNIRSHNEQFPERLKLLKRIRFRNLCVLAGVLPVIIWAAVSTGSFCWNLVLFTLIGLLVVIRICSMDITRFPGLLRTPFFKSYARMYFSFILLAMVLPGLCFFSIQQSLEKELFIKNGELHLLQSLLRKEQAKPEFRPSYNLSSEGIQDVYSRSFYNARIRDSSANEGSGGRERKALRLLRLNQGVLSARMANLMKNDSAACPNYCWERGMHTVSLSAAIPQAGFRHKYIEADLPSWRKDLFQEFSVSWISLALLGFIILFLIYKSIHSLLIKVFLLNFRDQPTPAPVDWKEEWNGQHLFLTGISEKIFPNELYFFDCRKIGDVPASFYPYTGWPRAGIGKNVVLLKNFEFEYYNHEATMQKLTLIEALISSGACVVVISAVQPQKFLELCHKSAHIEVPTEEHGELYHKWIQVLGHFREICTVVFETSSRYRPTQGIFNSNGLQDMEERVLRNAEAHHGYFFSVWKSLTWEEKYVLYDFAQDGLANSRNSDTIRLLLKKGILMYPRNGILQVTDKSFRNFILTEITPGEALELEKGVEKNDSWRKIKGPLVLVLLSVSLFLFITQQTVFNHVIAYITAFAALLPLVPKIQGAFGSAKGS
jgi:hypothetical protein